MPPKKSRKSAPEAAERGKDFKWTDDESELLLTVTEEYRVQQLAEGTSWESVKTKYDDILKLFRDHLPEDEGDTSVLAKDYPHKRSEITKDILSTKLKAIRIKFRQVS